MDLALPEALIRQAEAAHVEAVNIVAEELERELDPWIRLVARADAKPSGPRGFFPGDYERFLKRVAARFGQAQLDRAFEAVSRAVDETSFRKLAVVPGINPTRLLAGAPRALARFRAANARLIESLPEAMARDIGRTLASADVRSMHVRDVGKLLESRFSVAQSKAEFIARDQTLKLYANVNEARHKAAGVRRYIWEGSGDERQRGNPSGLWPRGGDHWSLNGTEQSWSLPPIVDPRDGRRCHPGEDYQCRCTAYPLFD